jgi:hypothetical protein
VNRGQQPNFAGPILVAVPLLLAAYLPLRSPAPPKIADLVAIYQGGGAFAALAASSDPEAHARYLRLARFVRDRQKKAGTRP